MSNADFLDKQRKAIEQLKEMQSKSTVKEPENQAEPIKKPSNSILGGINLPFLENLKTDGDLTLILGILLLLLSEKADKRLLFALIYILL